MRLGLLLTVGLMFLGCGDDDAPPRSGGGSGNHSENGGEMNGGAGAGGSPTSGAGGDSAGQASEGGTSNESGMGGQAGEDAGAGAGGVNDRGEIGTPMQIAPGQAALQGVTSDGWVVFRESDVLWAAALDDPGSLREITRRPGSVLIRGRVVFNWADIDWSVGAGHLSVWTADSGTNTIGLTPYSEALVGASEDGSTIVYTTNTHDVLDPELGAAGAGGGGAGGAGGAAGASSEGGQGLGGENTGPARERATDLVIASSDLASKNVLIASMGLGSERTCAPNLGFVGERLFIGWCTPGSRDAKIERYEAGADAWTPRTIAEGTLSGWSADAEGERVFYQSSGYSGYVALDGQPVLIDAGVSQGTLLPNGASVLYSVGDQLRRTDVPNVNPVAIVTTGYRQPVGFSRDFALALYSTTVTYENGTQQDLLLANTSGFNAAPLVLVGMPVATLPRSSMSRDGRFVFYLTDMAERGGALHVVDAQGHEVMVLPNVAEAAAANGSLLVFTDAQSDLNVYPVVADLKIIDVAREREPRLVERKVLNAKNFQVDPTGTIVSYVRSGVGRDSTETELNGVFSVTIH